MIKRRFVTTKIDIKSIKRQRFAIGLLLSVLTALILYSFLNILREVFRVLQFGFGETNGALVFNNAERFHYNFLCAALALILGNSMLILYCLGRPQKVFDKHSTKLKRVVNDQVFFNFNFLYWAFKMLFYIGLSVSMFLDLNLIEDYYYAFLLMLLVLYLESWKTLSQVIKKHKFKIQLTHFFSLLCLALLLAKCDVLDRERIDNMLARNNPTIQLPTSTYKDNNAPLYRRSVVKLCNEEGASFLLIDKESTRVKISRLNEYLNDVTEFEGYRTSRVIYLLAAADTKMKVIKKLEKELHVLGYVNIKYLVANPVIEKRSRFYKNGISVRLRYPDFTAFIKGVPPPWLSCEELGYRCITVKIDKEYSIGTHENLNKNQLKKVFNKYLDKDVVFNYEYSQEVRYQKFIDVLSIHKQAVFELRYRNAKFPTNNRCRNYDWSSKEYKLCKKERSELRNLYPFRFTDKIYP